MYWCHVLTELCSFGTLFHDSCLVRNEFENQLIVFFLSNEAFVPFDFCPLIGIFLEPMNLQFLEQYSRNSIPEPSNQLDLVLMLVCLEAGECCLKNKENGFVQSSVLATFSEKFWDSPR